MPISGMVLDADGLTKLSWSRHKETKIVKRMDLDPCGELWGLWNKGNDTVGRGVQGRKEKGSRMHAVHVLDRDFLRRAAWGTMNLKEIYDGSIVELELTSSASRWQNQNVDVSSCQDCVPSSGSGPGWSTRPTLRFPCRPQAPAVDDVNTAPRSSTHQSSFLNHTLQSKEN